MSETVRTYTGSGSASYRRGRGMRGSAVAGGAAVVIIVFLIWALWTTRDSYPMEDLIPRGRTYEIVLRDMMSTGSEIASSRVWDVVPRELALGASSSSFATELDLPEWVLNHLIGKRVYVSGSSLNGTGDVLLVTRMSRFGCLLERLHWFKGGIEGDAAGGLRLKHLVEPDYFYAVRGRVLIASGSRDTLIHCLTLQPDDAIDADAFSSLLQETGAEQVRGTVNFGPGEPLGDLLHYLSFAARIDQDTLHLAWEGKLQPEWQGRFGDLLGGAKPQRLIEPPDGMLSISANFGKPFEEVWTGLGAATGWPALSQEQWLTWRQATHNGYPSLPQLATVLIGPLGPGIRISLQDVVADEIVPIPVLVAVIDATRTQEETVLSQVPAPPPGMAPWMAYPRLDESGRRIFVPLPGGPTLEPTLAPLGSSLMIASNRTAADAMLAQSPNADALPLEGNLYIRIKPAPLTKALVNTGMVFAADGLLEGYSEDSFKAASDGWLERATAAEVITIAGALEGDILKGELILKTAPRKSDPGDAPPPASASKHIESASLAVSK